MFVFRTVRTPVHAAPKILFKRTAAPHESVDTPPSCLTASLIVLWFLDLTKPHGIQHTSCGPRDLDGLSSSPETSRAAACARPFLLRRDCRGYCSDCTRISDLILHTQATSAELAKKKIDNRDYWLQSALIESDENENN